MDAFGPGITIPRPRDSRWTTACANEVISRAGFPGKTIDQPFSDEEAFTFGKYLRKVQGVSFVNNIFKSALSDCSKVAGKIQDQKDCSRLNSVFTHALQTFVPVKSYRECWKNWTKPGARITTAKDLPIGSKFDSLVDFPIGGCSLDPRPFQRSVNCRIAKGSSIKMDGLDRFKTPKISADVVCKNDQGVDVVKPGLGLAVDCAYQNQVDTEFRMSRMMARNFNLDPKCIVDLPVPDLGDPTRPKSDATYVRPVVIQGIPGQMAK